MSIYSIWKYTRAISSRNPSERAGKPAAADWQLGHIPRVTNRYTPPLPDTLVLLADPAPRIARLLCRRLSEEADSAILGIDGVGKSGIRARHDLRVALRRLRVTLDAYAAALDDTVPSKLASRAQSLARRLGPARERDVLLVLLRDVIAARSDAHRASLSRAKVESILSDTADADSTAIRHRWRRLAESLRESLETWHEQHHIDGPGATIPFGIAAADALDRAADRIVRRCKAIGGPGDLAALHTARLTFKAARYLLAPLARESDAALAMVTALRDAQEQLGAINDASALRLRLRDWPTHEPGAPRASRAVAHALDACDADLAARIAAAFDATHTWRDTDPDAGFSAQLRAIAESWRRSSAPPMEFERKWLLSALPPRVRSLTPMLLRQGYLPGDTLVERIRCVSHAGTVQWIRTVKVGRGISRIEIEEAASATVGTALFALTDGKRVEKRRYTVDDGDLSWEIDEFTDRELVLAECELPDAAAVVTPPVWLAPYIVREVTDETSFTNWKLAR